MGYESKCMDMLALLCLREFLVGKRNYGFIGCKKIIQHVRLGILVLCKQS
jgi:hypothetical protein